MHTEKSCYGCKVIKPAAEFYVDATHPSGLSGYCKVCKRARLRKRYTENPMRYRATQARAPSRLDGRAAAYLRQWQIDNPDKICEYTAKRRALLQDAFVEDVDRRAVWGRDESRCRVKLVCDGMFVPFEEMHLDHIIPLSKGGVHAYYNVQTACAPCNHAKGARVLEVQL
jgi:5-methylcytosine-specific restriction endonuclease McrA